MRTEPYVLHPPLSPVPADASVPLDDAVMKGLVRDLHGASKRVFWADLLVTSAIGWAAFVFAVRLPLFSAGMVVSLLLAVAAMYRALCFMHEITHQTRRTLPGFEVVWNWLIGFPLLLPSFVYVGVHQDHHRLSSYGTDKDPEYLPFAHSSGMTTVFALESFFLPIALVARFLVLAPIGLLVPRFHRALIRSGSALSMNLKYRREVTGELSRKVRFDSLCILGIWATVAALAVGHVVPWRVFAVWLAMDSLVSFVNTLRTLGAHAYENEGQPLDRAGQLLDSIDTPGAFWTEIWAPVGLRYHALHHYFPGIPYHNLPEAYKRVVAHLPVADSYRKMTSRSLPHSLRDLYRKGLGSRPDRRLSRR